MNNYKVEIIDLCNWSEIELETYLNNKIDLGYKYINSWQSSLYKHEMVFIFEKIKEV
jgi:hypothetical protein